MTTKQPSLTAERCDECIYVNDYGQIHFPDAYKIYTGRVLAGLSPSEAELFAHRLLAAVKRAREEWN